MFVNRGLRRPGRPLEGRMDERLAWKVTRRSTDSSEWPDRSPDRRAVAKISMEGRWKIARQQRLARKVARRSPGGAVAGGSKVGPKSFDAGEDPWLVVYIYIYPQGNKNMPCSMLILPDCLQIHFSNSTSTYN